MSSPIHGLQSQKHAHKDAALPCKGQGGLLAMSTDAHSSQSCYAKLHWSIPAAQQRLSSQPRLVLGTDGSFAPTSIHKLRSQRFCPKSGQQCRGHTCADA